MKLAFCILAGIAATSALAERNPTAVIAFACTGGVSKVDALRIGPETLTVEEYRNGDDPVTHKRPGRAKFSNIVMKRGWASDGGSTFDFLKSTITGIEMFRKSGSVIFNDREGNEVVRVKFDGMERPFVRFPAWRPGQMIDGVEFGFRALGSSAPPEGLAAEAKSQLVWSPRSNVELYGDGSVRQLGSIEPIVIGRPDDTDGDEPHDAFDGTHYGSVVIKIAERQLGDWQTWYAESVEGTARHRPFVVAYKPYPAKNLCLRILAGIQSLQPTLGEPGFYTARLFVERADVAENVDLTAVRP